MAYWLLPSFPMYDEMMEEQKTLPKILPRSILNGPDNPFATALGRCANTWLVSSYQGGLLVRVDVPGVDNQPGAMAFPDGVDPEAYVDDEPTILVRIRDNVICFRAFTNRKFPVVDRRVYEGFLVIDHIIDLKDINTTIKDGILRMHIPGVRGTLHFYNDVTDDYDPTWEIYYPSSPTIHDCKPVIGKVDFVDEDPEQLCTIFQEGPELYIQRIAGEKGCLGVRLMREGDTNRIFARMDVPGVGPNEKVTTVLLISTVLLMPPPEVKAGHPAEESGRKYGFALTLGCGCCRIVEPTVSIMNGLLNLTANYVPMELHDV